MSNEQKQNYLSEIIQAFPWRAVIAILVIVLSFAYLFCLLKFEIPEGNRTVANVAAGLLLALDANIISYYFGSSKDSSDAAKASVVTDIVTKTEQK